MVGLEKILEQVKTLSVEGNIDIQISNICFDSRKVAKNDLFVAVRGTITDGHNYILSAISQGASAIVCEEAPERLPDGVCCIVVENSAAALALLASAYFGYPSANLRLVGVTGTNGKTTIATLLYNIFISLGYKSGLLSTVNNRVFRRTLPATHTTPDPLQLNSILKEMVDEGCEYAFMEVSSIALDQHRTDGLKFEGGIFTNLSHDHLDYHITFDKYIESKKRFFDSLPKDSFALINRDDKRSGVMVQNSSARIKTYSLRSVADYRCKLIEELLEGMLLSIDNREVSTRFIGDFNAYNILAVYGAAMELGADQTELLTAISTLTPVDGRLEIIRGSDGKIALVDYAHTPDALENVLLAINRLKVENNSIITVVGAGGDRDRTKRPVMGAIASRLSSKLILTSDNPRSESPELIIDEMIAGVPADLMKRVLRVTDRRAAIKTAMMLAGAGDIVLVAGKGHETYQEINGKRSHFDDREEIRKNLDM